MDSKLDRATIGRVELPNSPMSGAYKNIELFHGASALKQERPTPCSLLVPTASCGEAGLGKGTTVAESSDDDKSYFLSSPDYVRCTW